MAGAAFNQFRFERAAEDAWHLGLIEPAAAADYLERHRCRGKDGVSTMERLAGRDARGSAPTRPDGVGAGPLLAEPRSCRASPAGAPVSARSSRRSSRSTSTSPGPTFDSPSNPVHSWWHGGDLSATSSIKTVTEACSELGWLVIRFDETMRPRRSRRCPPGPAHLHCGLPISNLAGPTRDGPSPNIRTHDPRRWVGPVGERSQARFADGRRGGRNRGRGAVAWLAAVLTWRGDGIDRIPALSLAREVDGSRSPCLRPFSSPKLAVAPGVPTLAVCAPKISIPGGRLRPRHGPDQPVGQPPRAARRPVGCGRR